MRRAARMLGRSVNTGFALLDNGGAFWRADGFFAFNSTKVWPVGLQRLKLVRGKSVEAVT